MDGPSKRIANALDGKLALSELSEAELSAMRFPIYQQACVCLKTSKDKLVPFFESLSPEIRGMLKKECRRIYDLRRGVK